MKFLIVLTDNQLKNKNNLVWSKMKENEIRRPEFIFLKQVQFVDGKKQRVCCVKGKHAVRKNR